MDLFDKTGTINKNTALIHTMYFFVCFIELFVKISCDLLALGVCFWHDSQQLPRQSLAQYL